MLGFGSLLRVDVDADDVRGARRLCALHHRESDGALARVRVLGEG